MKEKEVAPNPTSRSALRRAWPVGAGLALVAAGALLAILLGGPKSTDGSGASSVATEAVSAPAVQGGEAAQEGPASPSGPSQAGPRERAAKLFEQERRRATDLETSGQHGGALRALAELPEELDPEGEWSEKLAEERARVLGNARTAWARCVTEARAEALAGNLDLALAIARKGLAFDVPEITDEATSLVAEVTEAVRRAEADRAEGERLERVRREEEERNRALAAAKARALTSVEAEFSKRKFGAAWKKASKTLADPAASESAKSDSQLVLDEVRRIAEATMSKGAVLLASGDRRGARWTWNRAAEEFEGTQWEAQAKKASEDAVDPSEEMIGTVWSKVDDDGDRDTWYFRAEGRIAYQTKNDRFRQGGEWTMSGNTVTVRLNDGYVLYVGSRSGSRMEGEATNKISKSWKWKATLQSNRPATLPDAPGAAELERAAKALESGAYGEAARVFLALTQIDDPDARHLAEESLTRIEAAGQERLDSVSTALGGNVDKARTALNQVVQGFPGLPCARKAAEAWSDLAGPWSSIKWKPPSIPSGLESAGLTFDGEKISTSIRAGKGGWSGRSGSHTMFKSVCPSRGFSIKVFAPKGGTSSVSGTFGMRTSGIEYTFVEFSSDESGQRWSGTVRVTAWTDQQVEFKFSEGVMVQARGLLILGDVPVDVNVLRVQDERKAAAAVQKLLSEAASACQDLATDATW